MITFEVNDMTCGHCVNTITKAVATVDPGAKVNVDLAAHRVHIEPRDSTAGTFRDAIVTAGFSPVAVAGGAGEPAPAIANKGCCCG